MKIKRVVQGTALAALAAAAWMGAGSTDASASVDVTKDVTASGSTLTINKGTNAEVMVSVVQVKDKKCQIKSWDVYDGNTINIDLSKLNVTKENYIAVMTDDAEPFFLKIAATAKPAKPTYNAKENNVKFGEVALSEVEFRTAFSNWSPASNCNGSDYQYQGASLYMRTKGALKAPVKTADTIDDKSTKSVTEAYEVYEIGSLPGKEAKLNIPKQANGPSLSGDYVKNTVKSKEGLDCRIVSNNKFYKFESGKDATLAVTSGTAISAAAPKQADLETIVAGFNSGDKIVFEVRTAATDKKPASKWARLDIVVPSEIDSASLPVQASGITTDAAVVTSEGAVKVSASFVKKNGKNGAIDYTNLELKNDLTDKVVDIRVGTDGKAAAVKGGKSVKYKKDAVNGKDIYVRVAGDKANKKWAGIWTKVGTVKFPENVAATTTDKK